MSAKQIKRASRAIDLDADEIAEHFEKAFQAVADDRGNKIEVASFDVTAAKENVGKDVLVEVTIYGMAGTTTRNEFQNPKTKKTITGGDSVTVPLGYRDGEAVFELVRVADINTNDYRLFYKLVK